VSSGAALCCRIGYYFGSCGETANKNARIEDLEAGGSRDGSTDSRFCARPDPPHCACSCCSPPSDSSNDNKKTQQTNVHCTGKISKARVQLAARQTACSICPRLVFTERGGKTDKKDHANRSTLKCCEECRGWLIALSVAVLVLALHSGVKLPDFAPAGGFTDNVLEFALMSADDQGHFLLVDLSKAVLLHDILQNVLGENSFFGDGVTEATQKLSTWRRLGEPTKGSDHGGHSSLVQNGGKAAEARHGLGRRHSRFDTTMPSQLLSCPLDAISETWQLSPVEKLTLEQISSITPSLWTACTSLWSSASMGMQKRVVSRVSCMHSAASTKEALKSKASTWPHVLASSKEEPPTAQPTSSAFWLVDLGWSLFNRPTTH